MGGGGHFHLASPVGLVVGIRCFHYHGPGFNSENALVRNGVQTDSHSAQNQWFFNKSIVRLLCYLNGS